jgi:hypothetical protein
MRVSGGKPKKLRKKTVSVPFHPPQIPHGVARDCTRSSAVRSQRLTAGAVVWPVFFKFIVISFELCFGT